MCKVISKQREGDSTCIWKNRSKSRFALTDKNIYQAEKQEEWHSGQRKQFKQKHGNIKG